MRYYAIQGDDTGIVFWVGSDVIEAGENLDWELKEDLVVIPITAHDYEFLSKLSSHDGRAIKYLMKVRKSV